MKKQTIKCICMQFGLLLASVCMIPFGSQNISAAEGVEQSQTNLKTVSEAGKKGRDMLTEEDMENDRILLVKELNIEMSDILTESMNRLYEKGCSGIVSVKLLKEEKGLLYFTVEDNNGYIFYIDTNKRGSFGTILSEEAYQNAQLLAESLSLELNRDLLYSAELLENNGCGKIVSVLNINHKNAYLFSVLNEEGKKYGIRMSAEGAVGEITDAEGNPIYAMYE